jgi:hypothetical protein
MFFRFLIIAALLLSVGCAAGKPTLKLTVEKSAGKDVTSQVLLETRYELEAGGSVTYNAETKSYEIVLASATTKDSDQGMLALVSQMMQMMQMYMMPGFPAPQPAGD